VSRRTCVEARSRVLRMRILLALDAAVRLRVG
jgi:hypothetical protein